MYGEPTLLLALLISLVFVFILGSTSFLCPVPVHLGKGAWWMVSQHSVLTNYKHIFASLIIAHVTDKSTVEVCLISYPPIMRMHAPCETKEYHGRWAELYLRG